MCKDINGVGAGKKSVLAISRCQYRRCSSFLHAGIVQVLFHKFSILPISRFISEILGVFGLCISQLGATFYFYGHGFMNIIRDLDITPMARLFFYHFSFSSAPKSDTLIYCSSRVATSGHIPWLRDPPSKKKRDDFIFIDGRLCPF